MWGSTTYKVWFVKQVYVIYLDNIKSNCFGIIADLKIDRISNKTKLTRLGM